MTLDAEQSSDYSVQRIGTVSEKQSVEKELAELRERLGKVEEWEKRRKEIDEELGQELRNGGREIPPPAYQEQSDDAVEASSEVEEGDTHTNT